MVCGGWEWVGCSYAKAFYTRRIELLGELDAYDTSCAADARRKPSYCHMAGNLSNTEDITRHMAKEGRSYSVAVSSLMRKSDIPKETPHYQMLMQSLPEMMADGGSCVAAPDGSWLVPPVTQKEGLITTTLILEEVFRARQNFDPAGHYARPDVIQLQVNRERQHLLTWKDEVGKG